MIQHMNITEFLLARIAEDEAVARDAIEDDSGSDEGFSMQYELMTKPPSGLGYAKGGFGSAAARMIVTYAIPARVLAECAAKRAIIKAFDPAAPDLDPYVGRDVIAMLAAVYKDHPEYQQEWNG